MADLFGPTDIQRLLGGRHVLLLGDSITRAVYKDLLWLSNTDCLLPLELLKMIHTSQFPDLDKVHWRKAGVRAALSRVFHPANRDRREGGYRGHIPGRQYMEQRRYRHTDSGMQVTFRFLTRVWSPELEQFLEEYMKDHGRIDVVVVNSSVWDLNRWGPSGPVDYAANLRRLVASLARVCPSAQVVYLTTPPCALEVTSPGMAVPGLEANILTACHQVGHANECAARIFSEAGHSVVDAQYYLQLQTGESRDADGLHWDPRSNRLVTSLLLTSLALGRGGPLPGRLDTLALHRLLGDSPDRAARLEEMRKLFESQAPGPAAEEEPVEFGSAYRAAVERERLGRIPRHPGPQEETYYSQLAALYRRHREDPSVPELSTITATARPRVYSDGMGMDTVAEFLDTNHPLWWEQRTRVAAIMAGPASSAALHRLAGLVAEQWAGPAATTLTNRSVCATVGSRGLAGKPDEEAALGLVIGGTLKRRRGDQSVSNKRLKVEVEANSPSELPSLSTGPESCAKYIGWKRASDFLVMIGQEYDKDLSTLRNSLNEMFNFNKKTKFQKLRIRSDFLFELASLEKVIHNIGQFYPSPYISTNSVEVSDREATAKEENLQSQLAALKEKLSRDGDIEKYLKDRKRLEDVAENEGSLRAVSGAPHVWEVGSSQEESYQSALAKLKEELSKHKDVKRFLEDKENLKAKLDRENELDDRNQA